MNNLDNGQEYDFRVKAKNRAGLSKPSDSTGMVEVQPKPTKASPPSVPVAEKVGKNSIDLAWQKPRDDGGSPIKGYIVEKKKMGGDWEKVNKQ